MSEACPIKLTTEADLSYLSVKRAIDIAVATVALVLLSPLLLVVSIAIFCTDRGNVLFKQKRVGKGGVEFDFYKFRSMVRDAETLKATILQQNEHDDDRTFKMRDDPRVTRIGKFIRKFSIDELPQLVNVLNGDMSLVGPRPAVPSEVAKYTAMDRRRLLVTPGITCIWQVSGRSEIPFPRQVEMDVEYIRNASLAVDVKILLKTVPAVLSARGAY